jgi:hypothetical protein
MAKWRKPENPPATLTSVNSEGDPENKEQMDNGRTRPPMIQGGTWGDRIFGNARHTSDPKAPKVS